TSISLATANGTPPSVTFTASGLPQGATLNPSTGMVSGIAGYANASAGGTTSYFAYESVSDSLGLLDTRTLEFIIGDTNRLPAASAASIAGQSASLNMAATDNT